VTQDNDYDIQESTAGEPEETAGSEQVEAPETELDPVAQLAAERDELKDRLLRLAAETDNYKKRSEREKNEFLKRANERLLKDLLPVMDNLERAMEHAVEEGGAEEGMIKGLELTGHELWKVMEKHGVERIEALGEPFDPEFHEAMMQQEDPDVDENTVIGVLQRGYLLHGRLLRPAMVIVSKRPAGQEDEPEDSDKIKITIN
jgi:molecular chaperone GrpE